MQKVFFLSILLSLLASCSNNKNDSQEKKEISECLGDILWKHLNENSIDYDLEIVLNTIKENAKGKRIPYEKPQTILSKHIEKLNEEQAYKALQQAEDFLKMLSLQSDSNIISPGKLICKILHPGSGSIVNENSSPLLHITEKDLEGDILFDTYKTNIPVRLRISETIAGFKLGVIGMQVGERREIFVHPDLAYKKLGKTKPNQFIIYDVTVVDE